MVQAVKMKFLRRIFRGTKKKRREWGEKIRYSVCNFGVMGARRN
jgi:hypothetical protein